MKGYRTIVVNILMAVASIVALWGIDIPPESIEAITTGGVAVFTVVNIILRGMTTTPVGEKS